MLTPTPEDKFIFMCIESSRVDKKHHLICFTTSVMPLALNILEKSIYYLAFYKTHKPAIYIPCPPLKCVRLRSFPEGTLHFQRQDGMEFLYIEY